MELLPFTLVIASAISHAAWNVLAKGGSDKEAFMWLLTGSSFFTMFPVFYVLLPDWSLPLAAVPFLLASGVAETLYFISFGRVYELGDYPSSTPWRGPPRSSSRCSQWSSSGKRSRLGALLASSS